MACVGNDVDVGAVRFRLKVSYRISLLHKSALKSWDGEVQEHFDGCLTRSAGCWCPKSDAKLQLDRRYVDVIGS